MPSLTTQSGQCGESLATGERIRGSRDYLVGNGHRSKFEAIEEGKGASHDDCVGPHVARGH